MPFPRRKTKFVPLKIKTDFEFALSIKMKKPAQNALEE